MKYTAYVFSLMELAEEVPASEFYPEMQPPPTWPVGIVPVLMESHERVTFTFGSFKGEIGFADGRTVRVKNIGDEAIQVLPEGLLLDDSTEFLDGPLAEAPRLGWRTWLVMFEFAP